jgi:hypothetical protein
MTNKITSADAPREEEIFKLIRQGLLDPDIAHRLGHPAHTDYTCERAELQGRLMDSAKLRHLNTWLDRQANGW